MPSTTASTPAPSNVISGKILHKESGNGVADLLVELYDLDNWVDPEGGRPAGDLPDISAIVRGDLSSLNKLAKRVASTLTTRSGEFTIPVTTKDFNVNGRSEQKPDLLLLVLGPDEPGYDLEKRLLHFAKDVRFNAGTNEAYIIRLPTRLLEEREIPFGDRKTESELARASSILAPPTTTPYTPSVIESSAPLSARRCSRSCARTWRKPLWPGCWRARATTSWTRTWKRSAPASPPPTPLCTPVRAGYP
jgi:hypothetical protein